MTWSSSMRWRIVKVAAVFAIVAILATGLNALFSRGVHGSGTGGIGSGPFPDFQNDHWAGYMAQGPSVSKPVSARVTIPIVTCNTNGDVSMWVGYDGTNLNSNTVEQDGVDVTCSRAGATPTYALWYELAKKSSFLSLVPKQDTYQKSVMPEVSRLLQPGDTVDMFVSIIQPDRLYGVPLGRDSVYFSLTVHSHGATHPWSKLVTEDPFYSPKYDSSECIVETPEKVFGNVTVLTRLPQFTPITFDNCSVFRSGNPVTGLTIARNGHLMAVPGISTLYYSHPADIPEFQVYWLGSY